jgi:hypothetical protein
MCLIPMMASCSLSCLADKMIFLSSKKVLEPLFSVYTIQRKNSFRLSFSFYTEEALKLYVHSTHAIFTCDVLFTSIRTIPPSPIPKKKGAVSVRTSLGSEIQSFQFDIIQFMLCFGVTWRPYARILLY